MKKIILSSLCFLSLSTFAKHPYGLAGHRFSCSTIEGSSFVAEVETNPEYARINTWNTRQFSPEVNPYEGVPKCRVEKINRKRTDLICDFEQGTLRVFTANKFQPEGDPGTATQGLLDSLWVIMGGKVPQTDCCYNAGSLTIKSKTMLLWCSVE